jgi:hypothetical protein
MASIHSISLFQVILISLIIPFKGLFALHSPSPEKIRMSPSMEIVQKFDALCLEGKYEEASAMLTDDFHFTNPRVTLDKAKWLKEFPALHADRPTFEEFQPGANDNQITRKGKKKVMMMNISMMETWELTEDGKIKSIVGAKA